MSSITVTVRGAEHLDDVFAATKDEVRSARDEGLPVQFEQERGLLEPLIVIAVGEVAKAILKPFLEKLTKRIRDAVEARKRRGDAITPFELVVDGTTYRLPEEMDRLRAEQGES